MHTLHQFIKAAFQMIQTTTVGFQSFHGHSSCDGVDIGNYHLNCLLYADDVILMSKTQTGLQHCIGKLGKYCDDWCREVNYDKSKVIVLRQEIFMKRS